MPRQKQKNQNIFIEGENLEVLHVLQRSYFGKIKMIYIDPPYNTGNDSFVYPDDYSERQDEYKKRAGITDKDGFLNKQDLWKKNSKESGQFHSVWLSMMYPRLYLARNLLREDGVIFISIGADELSNLISLTNEIFGEENRAGICVRQAKTGGNTGMFFSPNIEYILVYIKEISKVSGFTVALNEELIDKVYTQIETIGSRKGEAYRVMGLYQASLKDLRPNQKYFIECPDGTLVLPPCSIQDEIMRAGDGRWRWTKPKFLEELRNGNVLFKESTKGVLVDSNGNKSKWNIYTKIWLNDRQEEGQVPSDLILKYENRHSSKELQLLNIPFDFAKPTKLISHLQKIGGMKNNDIILDFFAGSGTTAHAVLDLNEQDGGNRQFICVQMPEPLEETSEAYKAGYKTIADICKARISKVIEKIQTERDNKNQDDLIPAQPKQALGFKSYKLSQSNFKQWRGDVDEQSILAQLELFKDSEKPLSKNQNMLVELLLKSGFPLTIKIEIITLAGQELYNVESGKLLFFFDDYNDTVKDFIFNLKPKNVVCLNRVFKNNDQALTNFQLGLKDAGIELQII